MSLWMLFRAAVQIDTKSEYCCTRVSSARNSMVCCSTTRTPTEKRVASAASCTRYGDWTAVWIIDWLFGYLRLVELAGPSHSANLKVVTGMAVGGALVEVAASEGVTTARGEISDEAEEAVLPAVR